MTGKNTHATVSTLEVDEVHDGQRIDNFLFTQLKGVPKSRIYRALRKGEFRVNKKRIDSDYRLVEGDLIRVPPLRTAEPPPPANPSNKAIELINSSIIYEDRDLIIINKPAGIAAHGGSGINYGVIEALRFIRPQAKFLELVHRLDRDTTGCMVISKKPSILKELHRQLVEGKVEKIYLAVVAGKWQGGKRRIKLPLLKNILKSGERRVIVHEEGKDSETIFTPLQIFADYTLMEAKPLTGRTHQIRVHAAACGHPILGDDKYGNRELLQKTPSKQLMLHSASLQFFLPQTEQRIALCASLNSEFLKLIK